MLIENLPNLDMVFGYTNASWTSKSDLISGFVGRIINRMDKTGTKICTAIDKDNTSVIPFIDMNPGYISRAKD